MLFGEYIRLMALVEYSADEIRTVFSDFPDWRCASTPRTRP